MTIDKRITDLLAGNAFASSGGSRLPALIPPRAPREMRPCSRCHLLTDARSLTPEPDGTSVCPVCYDMAGADMSEGEAQAYERLMAAHLWDSADETRRRAAWDTWAHRLTLLGAGVMGLLILLLLYKNTIGRTGG